MKSLSTWVLAIAVGAIFGYVGTAFAWMFLTFYFPELLK